MLFAFRLVTLQIILFKKCSGKCLKDEKKVKMSAEQHVCQFLAYSGSRSFRQAFEEIGKRSSVMSFHRG
jgi:hypothetical protein